MADKAKKARPKRLPKGQRTRIRRLKQAARKAGIAYIPETHAPRLQENPKKEEQA